MISNNEFDDWGQTSSPSDEQSEGAASSVDLMQVALRRKGLIALGIFVGLCLGLLYFARATPRYESSALLSIIDKSPPMATQGRLEQAFVMKTPAEDHAIRIKTTRIIGDALNSHDGELKKLDSLSDVENPVQEIYDGLTVQPIQEGSEVIALAYRGTKPDDAQMILDYIMSSYTDFLNLGISKVGAEVKMWITDEHEKMRLELETKTDEYNTWKETSNLFLLSADGQNMYQERQAKYEQSRIEERIRLGELSIQIDIIRQGIKDGIDPRALLMLAKQSSGLREDNTEQLFELEKVRAEFQRLLRSEQRAAPLLLEDRALAQNYGKDHPRRKALLEQIQLADQMYQRDADVTGDRKFETNKSRYAEQLSNALISLENEQKAGLERVRLLDAQFKNESSLARQTARDVALNASKLAEIQRLQAMYDVVVQKVADANFLEAYGGEEKLVIERLQDPAPGLKVEPSLAKSLAAGTMLGFMAGFGLGYLVEMFDKTFRSPQEVSKTLQLPMIGHIPEITAEPVEGSRLSEVLVAAHKPKSPLSENFRAIRTALYFSTAGQQTHVIQATSPVPGDGKSTITANLAITIAQSNKSVLLMDADFRRPTQHKLFGVSNDVGLASVVNGEVDPADAVQQTDVPNLHVMGCGPRPHNPSELLTSPNFADLLQVLREQFDFVLIDTPPVLAVTDPGIVAARVDGVILTMRIRKNGRPSAVRARKILHDLDANMLGIVVNGLDHRSGTYGYYSSFRKGYGYNYSYKYGYGQDPTEQALGKYFEDPASPDMVENITRNG